MSVATNDLLAFRDDFYACLHRRADALVELADAVLSAGSLPSPVQLSGEPVHRRGWGSLYAALAHGRIGETGLRAPLAGYSLADERPVYAVDGSVWSRCDAEASPERGYSYHPSRHSAGQPIVAGWSYQWVAQVGVARESWTAPLDARRAHPRENPNAVAVEQIARLIRRLPGGGAVPLFVFDAGYDSAQVQQGVGDRRAALLVRLRAGRCCYGDPPSESPGPKGGRPWRHGHKLACDDPATWPAPTVEQAAEDAQYGAVRVRAWAGVHPKIQAHERRGSRGPTPIVRGTLIRVEVARLPRPTREPQVLWLWWHGPDDHPLDLDLAWRTYLRRFDLEIQ